jgi:hypothetical protein
MREGRGDERPGFVEALALIPAAQREDRLSAASVPPHAALFESLRDERLAGGLDEAGSRS